MGTYEITCVVMEGPTADRDHTNIAKVGVGDERYTVGRVARWIDNGEHEFYTTNAQGRHQRPVITCDCNGRSGKHIRSAPDDRTDNNLESQPDC